MLSFLESMLKSSVEKILCNKLYSHIFLSELSFIYDIGYPLLYNYSILNIYKFTILTSYAKLNLCFRSGT
jgi:hypothetical protein